MTEHAQRMAVPMAEGFSSLGLPKFMLATLAKMNFTVPTPIQAQAIPLVMQGRDILGSAATGTGKTGAFGIPMVARLSEQPDATALILTPTRELAAQVLAMIKQLVINTPIKTALLIGGEAYPNQLKQLRMQPRIIVGTPGRVTDHLKRGTLQLDQTKFLVLDETDRMLDMGFGVQIDAILQHMKNARQTLLFSATLPQEIVRLSKKYLVNPERVAVEVAKTSTAKIHHDIVNVTDGTKYDNLLQQLESRTGSVIIFVKTKHGADKMADRLTAADHEAAAIHGDLRQNKRDKVIKNFREQKFRILVATDVAARGLDIPHIEHVINYDLPQCAEDYIHRIGRTGRAGAEGSALAFVTNGDRAMWRAIHRLMNPGEALPKDFANDDRDSGSQNRGSKSYAKRRPFGSGGYSDKKPSAFGDRKPKTFGDKKTGSFGDRKSGGFADRKPNNFGDKKPDGFNTSRDDKAARGDRAKSKGNSGFPGYNNDRQDRAAHGNDRNNANGSNSGYGTRNRDGANDSKSSAPRSNNFAARPANGDKPQGGSNGRPQRRTRAA